jgi:hypothetical protein
MNDFDLPLLDCLDEQTAVGFTGRINVLDRHTRQLLGVVILKDGNVHRCRYHEHTGLRAFHTLVLESVQLVPMEFIVEPEIVDDDNRQIHFPYSVLRQRSLATVERFLAVAAHKPPAHLKLLVRADFLESQVPVSNAEFQVLCALTEWSRVDELYQNCSLLPHEITESLVALRKKNALKVVGQAD